MTVAPVPRRSRSHRTLRCLPALLGIAAAALSPAAAADWAAARSAFETGRYAEAVAELEPLAAAHPDHTGVQAMLGVARLHAGDVAEAIEPLERAVADPARPDYRIYLAWALAATGQTELALDHLERISGPLPTAQAAARDRLLAFAVAGSSDPERGERLLRAATAREPAVAEPWIALGNLERDRGDHLAAAEAYRRAFGVDPRRLDVGRVAAAEEILAASELARGERENAFRRAAVVADALLASEDSADHRELASHAWFGAGRPAAALDRLRPLLESDVAGADRAWRLHVAGLSHLLTGNLSEAERFLQLALAESTSESLDRAIQRGLGHVYLQRDDLPRAATAFREAGDESVAKAAAAGDLRGYREGCFDGICTCIDPVRVLGITEQELLEIQRQTLELQRAASAGPVQRSERGEEGREIPRQ